MPVFQTRDTTTRPTSPFADAIVVAWLAAEEALAGVPLLPVTVALFAAVVAPAPAPAEVALAAAAALTVLASGRASTRKYSERAALGKKVKQLNSECFFAPAW